MRLLFKFISFTFHPIYMLTLAVVILLYLPAEPRGYILNESVYYTPEHNKFIFLMLFGVITMFAPTLSILVLKWNKIITSLEVTEKNERPIPYFIILVYFCIGYFFLLRAPENAVPDIFKTLLLSAIISVSILLLLVKFIKISGHTSGVAGITGVLFAYYFTKAVFPIWVLITLIIIIGIVGTTRVGLQQHKPSEVYLGAIISGGIGFMVTYFNFFI